MANTIPMYFATMALPTILRKEGVALTIIGLFGALMIPWALKFVWAPLLDKYYHDKIGRRKSWLIPSQFIILVLFISLLIVSPHTNPFLFFGLLVAVLIASATHYLASSAYILEQLSSDKIRFGNYAQVIGTAFGSFVGGGLFLIVYGSFGWNTSFIYVIGIMSCLFIIVCMQKETPSFNQQYVNPSIKNFLNRANMRHLLYFCLIYRGCEGLVMGMQQPFLIDNQIPIATIGKTFSISSLTISLIASGSVSILLQKYKENSWLLILGGFRSICYLMLGLYAFYQIHSVPIILGIVIINMACRSMEMVVLYTFFMKNCNSNQSATDISILICAELIIYSGGMMISGFIQNILGYAGLFFAGSLLSIISTMICAYILHKVIKQVYFGRKNCYS